MFENLFEHLTSLATRRGFLQRMAQAAGAIGLTLVGVDVAKASVTIKCCNLCLDPATCTYSNCASQWCWACCHDTGPGADFFLYSCDECYSATGEWCEPNNVCPRTSAGHTPGAPGCTSIKCSKITKVNPPISCETEPLPPPPPCDRKALRCEKWKYPCETCKACET